MLSKKGAEGHPVAFAYPVMRKRGPPVALAYPAPLYVGSLLSMSDKNCNCCTVNVNFEMGPTNEVCKVYVMTEQWHRAYSDLEQAIREALIANEHRLIVEQYVICLDNMLQMRIGGITNHPYIRRLQLVCNNKTITYSRPENLDNIVNELLQYFADQQVNRRWAAEKKNDVVRFRFEERLLEGETEAIRQQLTDIDYAEYDDPFHIVDPGWRERVCTPDEMPHETSKTAKTGSRLQESSFVYALYYDFVHLSLLFNSATIDRTGIGNIGNISVLDPSIQTAVNYRPYKSQGSLKLVVYINTDNTDRYREKREWKKRELFQTDYFETGKNTIKAALLNENAKRLKQLYCTSTGEDLEAARRLYAKFLLSIKCRADVLYDATLGRLKEETMFHGTSTEESVQSLFCNGVVSEMCNHDVYGRGTYCQRYLNYVLNERYSKIRKVWWKGQLFFAKTVILVRCIRGLWTPGQSNNPRHMFDANGKLFDSGTALNNEIAICWSTTISRVDGVLYLLWPVPTLP